MFDFADIPALTEKFIEDWKRKHPDYKPSYTGCKLCIDDQYERQHYGDVQSCMNVVNVKRGLSVKVPDAIHRQQPAYYLEDEKNRDLYDERKL